MIFSQKHLVILLTFFIQSCSFFNKDKQSSQVIATVGNAELIESDLKGIYAKDISLQDSINLRNIFIDNWINEEVVFQQALSSLPDSLKNKDDELNKYYRSLIRHVYEQELINRQLDTSVTTKEVKAYYEKFQGNFELKRPICRARIVSLSADVPKLDNVEDWFNNPTQENTDSLDKFCLTYAVKYQLDDNKWRPLSDVKSDLGLSSDIVDDWSSINSKYSHKDSLKVVFFELLEKRVQGDLSPMQLESRRIRDLIKNKKKVEFIRNVEKKILDEAKSKGEIEIIK